MLGLTLALSFQVSAQEVLFTVGDLPVYEDEFVAVFEKNRSVGQQIDPKTPEEYLELYIKFKLKIAEAYAQQRDTAQRFIKEFSGYRSQLAKPYLTDKASKEGLLAEAYARMQEEVRAAHIMYALPANALPEDTLATYNKIMALRGRIVEGALPFEAAARNESADTYSAKQGGDLGYFTVFNMVYPFESAAYNLEVGEVSMPVRSQYGYHLIKLVDRRPAQGKVRVRHIFFKANDRSNNVEQARAERSAQEAYDRLLEGEDFANLARTYSEDPNSADRGGELDAFGTNRMMPAFEAAAFELKNPGDFSQPVRTEIGWHVIQLIERIPVPPFEEIEPMLSRSIAKDSRANLGEYNFVRKLKRSYDFTVNKRNYDRLVKMLDLEEWAAGNKQIPVLKKDKEVITFNGQIVGQQAVLEMWAGQNFAPNLTPESLELELWTKFEQFGVSELLNYENSILEEKHPDFKHLVREYKEGILLFDLTQEEVWNKASKDTAGIAAHYESIKDQHIWFDRVNWTKYECSSEAIAKKLAKWAKKDKWDRVQDMLDAEDALDIGVVRETIETRSIPFEGSFVEPGVYGPIAMKDGRFSVVRVQQFLPSDYKSLKEIRGLVIASYQDELEREWVEALREKHPVVLNEAVVERVLSQLK